METRNNLPVEVENDIALYLSDGELILKSVSPRSEQVGRLGELWLVLTDQSVVFHTRETNKESVVALIKRSRISEITYFQHSRGVTLTFIPLDAPRSQTRASFSADQKDEIEEFCEDLADRINFQAETPQGLKVVAPRPVSGKSDPTVFEYSSPLPVNRNEPPAPPVSEAGSTGRVRMVEGEFKLSLSFVVLATSLSVLVGFIWLKLIRALSDKS